MQSVTRHNLLPSVLPLKCSSNPRSSAGFPHFAVGPQARTRHASNQFRASALVGYADVIPQIEAGASVSASNALHHLLWQCHMTSNRTNINLDLTRTDADHWPLVSLE